MLFLRIIKYVKMLLKNDKDELVALPIKCQRIKAISLFV